MTEVILPNVDETGAFTNPDVLARLDERYNGAGGGATTLDALTDVDTTGAAAGQVLVLGTDGQWIPGTVSTDGGGTSSGGTDGPAHTADVGNTAGSATGSNYAAVSTDLTVRTAMVLTGVTFMPVSNREYDLSIDGTVVATVTGTLGIEAKFEGFSYDMPAGTYRVSIRRADGLSGKYNYGTAPNSAYTGAWYDFTAGHIVELGTAYNLPAVYSIASTIGGTTEEPAGMALDELTDVDTTTTAPVESQVLTYQGGQWVPADAAQPQSPSTDVQGVLVIPLDGVVPADTPEGTLIFERTA